MSQPDDDRPGDLADTDPLLLFTTETAPVTPPAPAAEIPNEIDQPAPSPELVALRTRAGAAERSLRESRKEIAALKRQMATLVTAASDKQRAHAGRSVATGVVVAVLAAAGVMAWRFMPIASPPVVAGSEPVAAVESAPVSEAAKPFTTVAATTPLPARNVPARAQERLAPQRPTTYFGTLSVDAIPSGGEVFINRKSVGKTPVLITGLRAGSHLVWIQREGHRLFTRVVLVPADKVSRVSVALEPEDTVVVR